MNRIPDNEVVWSKVKYLKTPLEATDEEAKWEYEFVLPAPLSEWDVFSYWERERTLHMRDNLKKGEVLFDIGTEQGWLNLAYAQAVGPENMVLIEPTPEFWGNIRQTWEKNFDKFPVAFYDGLFSSKTTDERVSGGTFRLFPPSAGEPIIDRNKYQYIHDNDANIPEITLDDYVKRTGIIPNAITMDVEGAEFLVLQGANETLQKHHPKVWISIHPDMSVRDYGTTKEDVLGMMKAFGYEGTHLATDHEEHFYFEVKK